MAGLLTDLGAFALSVGRHWRAGVTGGAIAVALVLAGTLEIHLSKTLVLSALAGYIFVAAFFAWRDEYQRPLARPIQKRDRLDQLTGTGKALWKEFLRGKKIGFFTTHRIRYWRGSASRFVKDNFSMVQYDLFMRTAPRPGTIYEIELAKLQGKFPEANVNIAYEIVAVLEGLKRLRDDIRG